MKVLLIHQAFVSPREPGGSRHFEFGQRLATHGDTLTVVASQVSYLTAESTRRGRWRIFYPEQVDSVAVLRAYTPAVQHKSFHWRVLAFIVFAATSLWAGLRVAKTDLVMGTSPPIFQAVSAWAVARLRRRPFILEIRDLWPEFAINMGVLRNPVLQGLARGLERFLYRHADHLIVNSPAYRTYLREKGIPASKISEVANGVDVGMFDPLATGDTIRRRYDLDGKFLIVYAGALGMANDIDTILRAADRLRGNSDVQFLLVGDGKERKHLEQEARRRGLSNVTFTGALPKAEMTDVLAAADVCLATLMNISMFSMTYPNKVFDYMAAGRPTILTIDGVIRRVIEDADGGIFVPPGDDEVLAQVIVRLCADPAARQRMGESARAHVERHFNRDQQAEEFRRVLHQVVAIAGARTNGPPDAETSGEQDGTS